MIGFLILCGFFITGYIRVEDKSGEMTKTITKIETKLDDLLLRVPPVISPVPNR